MVRFLVKSAEAFELALPQLVAQVRECVARVFCIGDAARDSGADQSVVAREKKGPRGVIVACFESRAPRFHRDIRHVTFAPNMFAS